MKLKPKVIFVNGCFDLLHPGHIKMFQTARSLGDKLIVAIDSDRKIKEMKGSTRPINPVFNRKIILESIRYIDEVIVFDSKEELQDIVKRIKPDIMMVGSDWKGKEVVGSDYAKEVRFFDRIGDYSTTKIVESIADR
ncbi:bifunctional heptose 7-phosphate kinase/heptose 1-phosphate adenyltransferase [Synechococcus phage S-T4]|jgi:D-beta-D-heptose 7-phosphate kinase/D-beta-D-heptose 1-phosphate adenosyltransferase|uniref:ADP-heptose synthase / D-glycero-beta-D-manno-heptose 7-phosphate kinase n=1 Tax=Synechococcus phage S-T4 TaxID=2268578 RepID=A0A385EHH3_9CAUD|nr:bifunctional heptose 7-phosphate kinase/heptose 1-phosphate adenyltransferase [Synechococcus phage S-T4]AXQ70512.1 ADP-heptose synthase / D-glycero-beta-D-manno-heptose 7-phosphate kinase [Synechococcus phage S-T4]